MSKAPVTNAERAVQSAITDLWYQTYAQPLTTDERNQLAEDFIAQHITDGNVNAATALFVHPMTSRKIKQRSATILEILADYIMRLDQVEENHSEYSIRSQESEVMDEARREQRERVINYGRENDDHNPFTAANKGRRPPYSVDENSMHSQASQVESEVFAEVKQTAEAFRRQLMDVKKEPEKYAGKYAKLGYDYADALRRIKRLDPKRVEICEECGEAFYRHDMRRKICDMQHGMKVNGGRSEESQCELNDDKRRSEETRAEAREIA